MWSQPSSLSVLCLEMLGELGGELLRSHLNMGWGWGWSGSVSPLRSENVPSLTSDKKGTNTWQVSSWSVIRSWKRHLILSLKPPIGCYWPGMWPLPLRCWVECWWWGTCIGTLSQPALLSLSSWAPASPTDLARSRHGTNWNIWLNINIIFQHDRMRNGLWII